MKSKSDISLEDEEIELRRHAEFWNFKNPSYVIDLDNWREKLAEAKKEGYKSEKCSCGATYLAFHHYTMCREEGCPFNDGGPSILEQMLGKVEN